MLFGEQRITADMVVASGSGSAGVFLRVAIHDADVAGQLLTAREDLARGDVERLRDACEEFLR